MDNEEVLIVKIFKILKIFKKEKIEKDVEVFLIKGFEFKVSFCLVFILI